jgi:hypothetical protein
MTNRISYAAGRLVLTVEGLRGPEALAALVRAINHDIEQAESAGRYADANDFRNALSTIYDAISDADSKLN